MRTRHPPVLTGSRARTCWRTGWARTPITSLPAAKSDAALATGISAIDLDTGETSLLVEPENGYTLILPTWSPDGRFISFDELIYMEGRGPFAYYDFEAAGVHHLG